MKFTDKIRKKIDNAKSETEVKAILAEIKGGAEEAGVILDDEELDQASGGHSYRPQEKYKNTYFQ